MEENQEIRVSTQAEWNSILPHNSRHQLIIVDAKEPLEIGGVFACRVRVVGGAKVDVRDAVFVEACEEAYVFARNFACVRASENAYVTALDQSSVQARGNSRVLALNKSEIEAYDDSFVDAWENSCVFLHDRARADGHPGAHIFSCVEKDKRERIELLRKKLREAALQKHEQVAFARRFLSLSAQEAERMVAQLIGEEK